MTGNNPKQDLVNDDMHTKFGPILSIYSQDIERNDDMHTKFGPILSIYSQDIERKRNSDVNQGP